MKTLKISHNLELNGRTISGKKTDWKKEVWNSAIEKAIFSLPPKYTHEDERAMGYNEAIDEVHAKLIQLK